MNQIWKFSTILLAIIVVILGYMFYSKSSQLPYGTTIIDKNLKPDEGPIQLSNAMVSGEAMNINKQNETQITFLQDIFDFDTITSGETISRQLQYVNTGTQPFFIKDIHVSCGCTIPVYTTEPVKPGDTGFFSVDFKSKNKVGFSMNKMTVYGNLPNNEISTYFKVYIKEKK